MPPSPLNGATEYTSSGLFYGGGINQLIVQLLGVVIVAVWVLVTSGLLFAAIKSTVGLRVSAEEELEAWTYSNMEHPATVLTCRSLLAVKTA